MEAGLGRCCSLRFRLRQSPVSPTGRRLAHGHGWDRGLGQEVPKLYRIPLAAGLQGRRSPRINPLVDFYNAVSLRHVVPAGGFDLGEIDDTLELRLTRAGDAFRPLDGSAPESVDPGEVAYASGAEVLTRHFVYKQSRKALLDDSTTSLFLVSEVLGEVEAEGGVAEAVLESFARGLRHHFGAEPATFIVEKGSPEIPLR
jgi:DNA/RNA-binding domain of Phe-tRNA-synthetase-like protein